MNGQPLTNQELHTSYTAIRQRLTGLNPRTRIIINRVRTLMAIVDAALAELDAALVELDAQNNNDDVNIRLANQLDRSNVMLQQLIATSNPERLVVYRDIPSTMSGGASAGDSGPPLDTRGSNSFLFTYI